jgi:hypothetical protein
MGEAETIRSRHMRDEAFIMAAGRYHYVYGLMILALSVYLAFSVHEMTIAVDAPRGKRNYWWYWASLTACLASLAASNILVGYGLRRLRDWAFRTEYAVVLLVLLVFALVLARVFQNVPLRELFIDALLTSLIASPIIVLIFFVVRHDVRIVATSDYRAIIERTRRMKVRPALPVVVRWSLFLAAAGLAFSYWIAMIFLFY